MPAVTGYAGDVTFLGGWQSNVTVAGLIRARAGLSHFALAREIYECFDDGLFDIHGRYERSHVFIDYDAYLRSKLRGRCKLAGVECAPKSMSRHNEHTGCNMKSRHDLVRPKTTRGWRR